MKEGTTFLGMKTVFEVTIEGRGGDSVRDEYFATSDEATLASAVDGGNKTPMQAQVMEFSDGSLISPHYIRLTDGPSEEEKEKLLAKLQAKQTPAQRILLGGRAIIK